MDSVTQLADHQAKTCECGMPTFDEYDTCRKCLPQKDAPEGGFDKAPWED